MDGWEGQYVKGCRARPFLRLRSLVSKEEFDATVKRLVERGLTTFEEVEGLLREYDMNIDSKPPLERAIALLEEHGELTGGQMHAMLGLAEDECPSEVLAEGLEAGYLIKEGKYWSLPDKWDARSDSHYMPTPAQVAAFPRPIPFIRKVTYSAEERAVEYLRNLESKRCTNPQMVALLGTKTPTTSLQRALERETLQRDGTDWLLGPNRRTNVEQAIEYLKDHPERRATHAEMCQVLGFKSSAGKAALDAALRSGLQSGKLIRAGSTWILRDLAEAA